jgi:hypothetical protein
VEPTETGGADDADVDCVAEALDGQDAEDSTSNQGRKELVEVFDPLILKIGVDFLAR